MTIRRCDGVLKTERNNPARRRGSYTLAMKRLIVLFLFSIVPGPVSTVSGATTERVVLFHFSDYHSHAVPSFQEGEVDRGGIARTIGYLRRQKLKGGAFVFSGGDMLNRGAPAWSDKYGCIEWPWLNGIVDAMAFGNHDSDFGAEAFARCQKQISYPILGANLLDKDGRAIFRVGEKPYVVLTSGSIRIGVIALAGSDFLKLMPQDSRPPGMISVGERIQFARTLVRSLREEEKVHAVIVIGHAHRQEDVDLARSVPGIDLIFGTHSHIKEPLHRIEGTSTYMISPFQYLSHVSAVELSFQEGKLTGVEGKLVPMDRRIRPDPAIAKKVKELQRALESDPEYRELFEVIGSLPTPLLLEDQLTSQTPLGQFVMNVVRRAAGADVALSTTSSFRHPLAAGPVKLEDLRAALPYPNRILVYSVTGADLKRLVALSQSKRQSDSFAQFDGGMTKDGRLRIERDGKYQPVVDDRRYRVATTDYLARVADGYRDFFETFEAVDTGLEVRDEVRKKLANGKRQ